MADDAAGESPGEVGEWVTVAEAARRIGVTPKAIRERIRHGSVRWKPNGNAGRLILVDEPSREPPGEADDVGGTLAELREALAEERIARARIEERLAASERRETELRTAFARERATLEERGVELAAILTAERARANRLEAALVEARRPWLAKVLEGLRRKES